MKLATLKNGTRDGALVVVSKDLDRAVSAGAIATTLISALEDWRKVAPRLDALYKELNAGAAKGSFAVEPSALAAPLPRSPQWLDGSAFHSHGDLMEKAFKMPPIEGKHQVPLMYQGASDDFLGARDPSPLPSEEDGIDFEGEVAVIVDEVPMGCPAGEALQHVRLVLLVNDTSLRTLAPREMKTGFGFLQSKPSTAFSLTAVTPDELGEAWKDGRVHLPVKVQWNGKAFGGPNAGEMGFGFHQLITHAARTRKLTAGTIIGSGTVSNATYREVGSACIAERRGIEIVDTGEPKTAYMCFGDTVTIDMLDRDGHSIFGAIHQRITNNKTNSNT
jgi:fumarylacetoacetate (FAA) hydrolase